MSVGSHGSILLIEPYLQGHHGTLLELISRGLADKGYAVVAQSFKPQTPHPVLSNLRRAGIEVIEMDAHEDAGPAAVANGIHQLVLREFSYWRLFREWQSYAQKHHGKFTLVFLPYLDYCLYSIALLGSPFGMSAWGGLAMRPAFHYASMGVLAPRQKLQFIKKGLFFRMLANRHLKAFITIDELLAEYLQIEFRRKAAVKVHFIPDPIPVTEYPQRSKARAKLALSQDRKLILAYGALDCRKGIIELVSMLWNPAFPTNADIMLVGEQMPDIQSFLASDDVRKYVAKGRLKLFSGFIPVEEEGAYFAASDIVWLGYKSFYGNSGVLVQAARAARPVIACREGMVGWQVGRYQCGVLVDPTMSDEVVAGVNTLLTDVSYARECGNKGLKAFAQRTVSDAMDRLSRCLEINGG